MSARERDRTGWWGRSKSVLRTELGWFGIPVKPKAAQIIERAGLPPEASALVLRIVKRTRLRRGEKRDVARELCGHFLDGIESGAEVSELIRLFGDEKAAAKLIRRGKLRNRGIFWKSWVAMRWGALGVVGVFLCAYVIFAVRLALSERVISHDYLAEFNAPALAVPVEERGWTMLQPALPVLEDTRLDVDGVGRNEKFRDLLESLPGESDWGNAVAFLDEHQEALDTIRRAAAAPRLAFVGELAPTDSDGALSKSLINVLLPHLRTLRRASKLLALDWRRAATDGNGDRVVLDARALSGLARGAAEYPSLIGGLVAVAIDALLCDLVAETLRDSPEPFSDANLRNLAHVLGASGPQALMANALRGERAFFEDTLQRVYTDNGNGDGLPDVRAMHELAKLAGLVRRDAGQRTGVVTAMGPVAAMAFAGRREMTEMGNAFYGTAEVRMNSPMWEWNGKGAEALIEALHASLISGIQYFPLTSLAPAVDGCAINKERAIQMHDATEVAISLELYRRRAGSWPRSLDQLVPALLPSVPQDRFTGGPIGYALRDGEPVIYSAGIDRDDDGGRPPAHRLLSGDASTVHFGHLRTESEEDRKAFTDGDWILWPPQKD